jgi:hypothetical protein
MKTAILDLEVHDDIVSACDKMEWAKSARILLVWPEAGKGRPPLLNRRLDLLLLQRHSQALGAQLALVSRDREVRYHAPRLGIPVYKNLRQAQTASWRLPRRFRRLAEKRLAAAEAARKQPGELPERPEPDERPLSALARLGVFALGVLALLAIAATLAPAARITVTPRTETQQLALDVRASPETKEIDLSGRAPARPLTVTVEGRDAIQVSGAITLPLRAAGGSILFTNLTDQAVAIPEDTVVRTPGTPAIRFTVTRAGQAPAGPGQTVSLPARALQPGKSGNLPANSLTAIEGPLGTRLTASNPARTTNGADRREPVPSAEDRRMLASRLQVALEQSALRELQSRLAPGDVLIPASLELVRVHQESFQPPEDSPASQLSLSQQLEFQALAVSGKDLDELALAIFDANLLSGATPLDHTLQVASLGTPEALPGASAIPAAGDSPVYHWPVHASRQIHAHFAPARAVQIALGLSPAEAAGRLQAGLPLEESPHIEISPRWWPRLPILPFRIQVINALAALAPQAGASGP